MINKIHIKILLDSELEKRQNVSHSKNSNIVCMFVGLGINFLRNVHDIQIISLEENNDQSV